MAWEKIENNNAPIDTIDDMSDKINDLVDDMTTIQKKDNINAKTGAYTLVKDSDYLITTDADSADFTVTLPAASSCSGQVFLIKHIGSTGLCTVDAGSGVTIDGNRYMYLVQQYACATIISDGTNWHVIASYGGRTG